jgi:sortase A
VLSLLIVGVGIVVAASFYVGSPRHDAQAEVAAAKKGSTVAERPPERPPERPAVRPAEQPELPVAAGKIDRAIERQKEESRKEAGTKPAAKKKAANRGPKRKMLRMTIPKMAQIHNDTVPYTVSDNDKAFHDHAAVHLRGTGDPWDKQANVYIAGHRLGFPGTNSWLSFWDLNVLEKGDRIFISDAAGKRYVYKVFKVFIVDPDDVSVTRPLEGRNIVSLQTCTLPDYSKRLIVQAEKVAGR